MKELSTKHSYVSCGPIPAKKTREELVCFSFLNAETKTFDFEFTKRLGLATNSRRATALTRGFPAKNTEGKEGGEGEAGESLKGLQDR